MRNDGSSFYSFTPVVKNLIIINFICWLACLAQTKSGFLMDFNLYDKLSLHYWESEKFMPGQLITYMFLHDKMDITHILFNMFNLFMFGPMIERTWGSARFFVFYIVCGVGAAISQEAVWSHMLMNTDIEQLGAMVTTSSGAPVDWGDLLAGGELMHPINFDGTIVQTVAQFRSILLNQYITVGASGAIFGIMLAFAMTFPNMPLFFFFIPVPIKAKYMIAAFAAIELYCGISASGDGVAHYAHLGGMLFGFLLILFWRKTGKDQGPLM